MVNATSYIDDMALAYISRNYGQRQLPSAEMFEDSFSNSVEILWVHCFVLADDKKPTTTKFLIFNVYGGCVIQR